LKEDRLAVVRSRKARKGDAIREEENEGPSIDHDSGWSRSDSIPTVAFAQGSGLSELGGIELTNLFGWAAADPPDWGRKALFAGLGLAGALVTVFGLIGGVVPGTAGKAKIEADVE
jgi:hypothetical protein